MEAICKYCKQPFTYAFKQQRKVEREVCDPCRDSRRHWARKKVKRSAESKERQRRARRRELRLLRVTAKDFAPREPGEFLPRRELAAKLGISEAEVIRIEEQALNKLRGSTLLQEAYGKFKQDGKPLMEMFIEQLGERMRGRDEARVMAMQQELVAMWQRHDAWSLVGRKDPVARTAALEIKTEIEKCRTALLRELGKIPFVGV